MFLGWGSLFCLKGRIFAHNDCPGADFCPFESCPGAGWFWMNMIASSVTLIITAEGKVHLLSSSKGEMFLCAACHAFTPHVNALKN